MSKRMLYHINYIDTKEHVVVDEEKVKELLGTKKWFKLPMDASKALLKTLSLEKEDLVSRGKEVKKPKRKYVKKKPTKLKEE